MTRRRSRIGVNRHSWIVFVPRWLAIVLVTVIAFLVSPTTSALGAPGGLHRHSPGYSTAGDSKGDPDDGTDSNGPYQRIKVPWGSGDMAAMFKSFLKRHPEILTSGRNVGVLQLDPTEADPHTHHFVTATVNNTDAKKGNVLLFDAWKDGVFQGDGFFDLADEDDLLRMDSPSELLPKSRPTGRFNPVNKHSEQLLAVMAEASGSRERVTVMLSALDACTLPSNNCRQKNESLFPNLKTYYFYSDNIDEEKEFRQRFARGSLEAASLFGSPSPQGAAARALAPGSDPGGIDFSTLELRYLAEGSGGQLQYAFNASPAAASDHNVANGQTAAVQTSDAFFVWLALPTEKFWVNLHPTEPDRIIDDKMGTTDVGRILLQADFQMKKLVGQLIHPDTDLGTQYWGSPYDSSIRCSNMRLWIVSAPATVYEQNGGLYIVDTPLQVKMETDYLKQQGETSSCITPDMRMESTFRTLVLPKVEDAVNHAPEFAELRRVYLSRVAAEWYRQRHNHGGALSSMIDSDNVSAWPARQQWSPHQVFNQYVDSYQKKEFNITKRVTRGDTIYENTYTYGGVDFSNVVLNQAPQSLFQRDHADLPGVVQQSIQQLVTDQHGKVWLGATSHPVVQQASDDTNRQGSMAGFLLAGYLLVGVAVLVIVMVNRKLHRARNR